MPINGYQLIIFINTIDMLTAANGSYKNTIIIREVDDTYIFVKDCTAVILASVVDAYSFPVLETLVNQAIKTSSEELPAIIYRNYYRNIAHNAAKLAN